MDMTAISKQTSKGSSRENTQKEKVPRVGKILGTAIRYLLLALISLAMAFPFYWMVISGFKTNDEIGKKIFISEKTVKTHLTNIFDKLKVNNRFKAALMIMGQKQEKLSPG